MKLAITGVAIAALASSASAACDQSYLCQYQFNDVSTNTAYNFDFSSLCDSNSGKDWVVNDEKGHTYSAKICGTAAQNCLPATWHNTYEYGVAVQTWGGPPAACPPKTCSQKNPDGGSTPACCTKNCQVLGTGNPTWFLTDPSNPQTGGVTAKYKGAAPSDSDPYWCSFNPATGAQYEREAHFVFQCDPSVSSVNVVKAIQNSSNYCRYKILFGTQYACAATLNGGMSGGWVFILILFIGFIVYVVVGALITYSQERVWAFPNKEFWGNFFGLVSAGVAFVTGGCKKGGSGGGYSDVGTGAPASGGGGDVASSGYQGSSTGASDTFTDL